VRLQSSSARTRNAVLHALENIRLPPYLSKLDLSTSFKETFRVILPDTSNGERRPSSGSHVDETEQEAIDILCARLSDRQVVHRVSDREVMHSISKITRNIELLDDPSGQFRASRPKLYVVNCGKCHLAGDSQLKQKEHIVFPVRMFFILMLKMVHTVSQCHNSLMKFTARVKRGFRDSSSCKVHMWRLW
jgi:hypothetical protein